MSGETGGDDGLVLSFNFGGGEKSAASAAEAKQKAMMEKLQKREEERKKKEEERKKKKEAGESEEPEVKTKPKVTPKGAKATKPADADAEPVDEPKASPGDKGPEDTIVQKTAVQAPVEESPAEPAEVVIKPSKPKAPATKPAPKVDFDDMQVGGSKKSNPPPEFEEKPPAPSAGFDEDRPLKNKKTAFVMSEYPEGEEPPAESIDDGTAKIVAKGGYNLDDLDDANPFGAAAVEDEATLRKGPVEVRAVDKKSVKKRMYAFQELLEIAK